MSRSRYRCGFCDNKLDHDDTQTCPNVTCARCGGKGHYGMKCMQITCERCQEYGHTKIHCYERPRCRHCKGRHLSTECPKIAEQKEREILETLAKSQNAAKEALDALVEVKANADTEKTCIICKDQPRQWACMPCCHFLYCKGCIDRITDCSQYRETITNRMKIFT